MNMTLTKEYKTSGVTCNKCMMELKRIINNGFGHMIEDMNGSSESNILSIRWRNEELSLISLNHALIKTKYSLDYLKEPSLWKKYSIIFYITLISSVFSYYISKHSEHWVMVFMGIWYTLFAILKLSDVEQFSKMLKKYDIIASKIPFWGKIYPFIEAVLGLWFISEWNIQSASIVGLIFSIFSIIGVIKVIFSKQKIKCACVGTSAKMNVGWVTFSEQFIMIVLGFYMLLRSFGLVG
jgi:uncharacterized membrane protein